MSEEAENWIENDRNIHSLQEHKLETKVNPDDIAKRVCDMVAAYNRHDIEPYIAMYAPDVAVYDSLFPEIIKGREVVRERNEAFQKACPDLELKILNMSVQGDVMALELMLIGTFKGPLELSGDTMPPTGRHFEQRSGVFGRLNSKGLITEVHNYHNPAALLQQLGIKE